MLKREIFRWRWNVTPGSLGLAVDPFRSSPLYLPSSTNDCSKAKARSGAQVKKEAKQ